MRHLSKAGKLTIQRNMFGFVFLAPWLVGFLLFFCYPFIQSLFISFQKVSFLSGGGLEMKYLGLSNYVNALTSDENFIRYASQSLLDLATSVPVCLTFSFFVAVLLHQKFHGNFLAKTVFFMPVILGTGLFLSIVSGGNSGNDASVENAMNEGVNSLGFLQSMNVANILAEIGIPENLIALITGPINQIYSVISMSSIQVFVFLAGLNSINASLYEAAYVEGANGWTSFWKITFPMVSPLFVVNVVYTLMDNFTMSTNTTMKYIQKVAFQNFNFGLSGAMMWLYSITLAILVGLFVLLISKRVVYQA